MYALKKSAEGCKAAVSRKSTVCGVSTKPAASALSCISAGWGMMEICAKQFFVNSPMQRSKILQTFGFILLFYRIERVKDNAVHLVSRRPQLFRLHPVQAAFEPFFK